MVSNGRTAPGPSDVFPKKEQDGVHNSAVAQPVQKGAAETSPTSRCRKDNLLVHSQTTCAPVGQPRASTSDSINVLRVQGLTSPRKSFTKAEDDITATNKAFDERKVSDEGGAMTTNMTMSEADGFKGDSDIHKDKGLPLNHDNPSGQKCTQSEKEHDNPSPNHGSQLVSPFPETEIQPSPIGLDLQTIPIQPRYLRKEEYLAAVMTSTLADFTNPLNALMQDAFLHGKYEHLLGYANALDNAGQITSAHEVIILATAQCFRPLGLLREVDQNFELTANILKYCHGFAREQLLSFLQTMLERAPAAFMPRGEAFIPILDGFAAVLSSYTEVVPVITKITKNNYHRGNPMLEKWNSARENAADTLGILQWCARQPAHWASMNGSRMLLIALSELFTDPRLDRATYCMIVEFMSLNHEFLSSVDKYMPQNAVLETILSTLEHALQKDITSLQYPDFMTLIQLSDVEAEAVVSAVLTILYHYSSKVPRENLGLTRFVAVMTELIGGGCYKYRGIIWYTTKQLFERFPDEFDVCRKFVETLGEALHDDSCREASTAMLRIIRDRITFHEEVVTK